MPESASMPTFTVGRLVSWVIIALINWDQITV